jgi:integrase
MPKLLYKHPEYVQHKASGRARVFYDGKYHYLPGKYGSPESREAYYGILKRLKNGLTTITAPASAEEAPRETIAPKMLTIPELIERYWEHCENYYRGPGRVPTGETANIKCALRPLLELFDPGMLAMEFKTTHLETVRDHMIECGWSRKYINKAIGKIKRLFKWAVGKQYVTAEVFGALAVVEGLEPYRTEARETEEVEGVPDDVIEATVRELAPDTADMVRVARLCACRPGELVNINAEEIDRRDPDCWWYRPKRHKNAHRRHKRSIPLNREAQVILLPYIVAAGTGKLFRFKHRDGLRQAIYRACARAFPHSTISAIPESNRSPKQCAELAAWNKAHRWHPNQLRHAALQEAREKDGPDGAQALGGHKHLETTEIYTSVNESRAKQAAAKIKTARASG